MVRPSLCKFPCTNLQISDPACAALKESITRKHAYCPLANRTCFSSQCRLGGGGGGLYNGVHQVNKFEQVSSVGHRMSLAGGRLYSGVPCPGEFCTVSSNASWVMVAWTLPWTDRHTTENITFPLLRWRVVKIYSQLPKFKASY